MKLCSGLRSGLLLPVLVLAGLVAGGCGGSSGNNSLDGDVLAPGYYAVTARVLRSNAAASDYNGRVSVANDGTVRVFAVDPNGSRLSIVRTGTTTEDRVVTATLNDAASNGDLTVLGKNLVTFDGPAFTLQANGAATPLPAIGTGRTLNPGVYAGELVRVETDGTVTEWGNASGLLAMPTSQGGTSYTIQTTLSPAVGAGSAVQAVLATDGTATSTSATAANWSSDGTTFVLRVSGGSQGTGTLFIVLTRRNSA